jgi:hypothetical protein
MLSLISTRNNRRAALALAAVCGAMLQASRAEADLSGVWVVTNYARELKTADGNTPPLLPDAAKLYNQRRAQLAKGDSSFDIVASRCGPPGLPRVMMLPYAFEIVQNPQRLVFLFEWNRMYRRVDIDGPSMNAEDLQLTGRATGRWEGTTLAVTTTDIDDTLLDASGMPHSSDLKITERLHLLDDKTLEDDMRLEDDKSFSAPWNTKVIYRKLPKGYEVKEFVCLDHFKTSPAVVENNYLNYPR